MELRHLPLYPLREGLLPRLRGDPTRSDGNETNKETNGAAQSARSSTHFTVQAAPVASRLEFG